ncbi:MAG: DinB family protein [Bacillota bacterium]|nr:DinB family protein [Bacillota bacterium]
MENNAEIRMEVLQSVSGLSDQQLNERINEGTWTIMQVLHHLYLTERAITHSITAQLTNEESTAATAKSLNLATDRTTKLDAPSYTIPTEDFMKLDEIKKKLQQSRYDFNKVVEAIDEDALIKKSFKHPFFGFLTLKQWIPFVGLHEKRHLAQIEEIKHQLLAHH